MADPKISRFELQLLEKLWELAPCSVREIQEGMPEKDRPAYTTVQTMIYRLEEKRRSAAGEEDRQRAPI